LIALLAQVRLTGRRPGAWAYLDRHDQADTKIGISSLALTGEEEVNVLRGKIQMDDAYLGEEHPDGKAAGHGTEDKIPILAAVTVNEASHPINGRISTVSGFSSAAVADRGKHHQPPTAITSVLSPAASTPQPAAVQLDQGDANNLKNSKSQKKRQEILLTLQIQLLSDSKDENKGRLTPGKNQVRCQKPLKRYKAMSRLAVLPRIGQ